MNLLRWFERTPPPPARFAPGRVGYAIGDIHGRADVLALLLDQLEARAEQDVRSDGPPLAIFLGDYVDRGRDSAAVVDLLLEGRPRGFERRFLKGNHEQIMLDFLDNPLAHRAWLIHGGAETLRAYGVTSPPMNAPDQDLIATAQMLRMRVPEAHLAFLQGLERFLAVGDYVFVHAGIDPSRALEEQSDADLFWARARFLASKRRFSHRVVHGHTPTERPYADARRIGIDTGAYASGVLTAVRLEDADVSFLSATARPG